MTVLLASDPTAVGPYRLLGRLGSGGMGQVFLAKSEEGELVAVKVVHAGLAHDERFRARFAREVEVSRQVTGPWTAAVLDADPDAAAPWLATEYVPGPALDHAVQAAGPLPATAVHVLAAGLARALVAIHGAGLLHRDVKPSNVLLAADGPRLIDFGIARAVDGAGMTSTGMMIGTPAFMSPEQAEGAELGPASDVYSLGAVLVLAATGSGPFGEGSPVVLMRRILDDEPDLGKLADPVRELAARCLARDPAARPTAAELVAALDPAPPAGPEGWLPGEVKALLPQPAPEPPSPPHQTSTVRRVGRRAVLGGVVLAGLGAIGVAVAVGAQLGNAAAERARPRVQWTYTAREDVQVLAVDSARVYAGSADATVHALDAGGGRPQWAHAVDAPVTALILSDSTVTVSDGTRTYGLDAGSGERRWEHDAVLLAAGPGGVLVDGVDFLAEGEPRLVRWLDLGAGTELWSRLHRDIGLAPGARVALTPNAVHLLTHGRLLTLDAATGSPLWERALPAVLAAAAALSGAALYVGEPTESPATRVVALDPRTGAELWEGTHGSGLAELTVDRNAVYAAGGDRVTAWSGESGTELWTWNAADELGAAGRGGAGGLGPTAGAGGLAHVVADTAVSLDARQSSVIALDGGAPRWRVDLPPAPTLASRAGPVAAPDGPVVAAVGPTLYAIMAG